VKGASFVTNPERYCITGALPAKADHGCRHCVSDRTGSAWCLRQYAAGRSEEIKATDRRAQDAVTGLLSGKGVEVHEAMIATQRADLTFELALQVRNKAVSAYQQMMQMQF
jgi:hypothetical protein